MMIHIIVFSKPSISIDRPISINPNENNAYIALLIIQYATFNDWLRTF